MNLKVIFYNIPHVQRCSDDGVVLFCCNFRVIQLHLTYVILISLSETEKDLAGKLHSAQTSLREKMSDGESASAQWQNKLKNLKEQYEAELRTEKENNTQLRQTYETRIQEENRSNGDRFHQVVCIF